MTWSLWLSRRASGEGASVRASVPVRERDAPSRQALGHRTPRLDRPCTRRCISWRRRPRSGIRGSFDAPLSHPVELRSAGECVESPGGVASRASRISSPVRIHARTATERKGVAPTWTRRSARAFRRAIVDSSRRVETWSLDAARPCRDGRRLMVVVQFHFSAGLDSASAHSHAPRAAEVAQMRSKSFRWPSTSRPRRQRPATGGSQECERGLHGAHGEQCTRPLQEHRRCHHGGGFRRRCGGYTPGFRGKRRGPLPRDLCGFRRGDEARWDIQFRAPEVWPGLAKLLATLRGRLRRRGTSLFRWGYAPNPASASRPH